MTKRPTTIERAFELARSGEVRSVAEIVRRLDAERFEATKMALSGPTLRRQLRQLCLDARAHG